MAIVTHPACKIIGSYRARVRLEDDPLEGAVEGVFDEERLASDADVFVMGLGPCLRRGTWVIGSASFRPPSLAQR